MGLDVTINPCWGSGQRDEN